MLVKSAPVGLPTVSLCFFSIILAVQLTKIFSEKLSEQIISSQIISISIFGNTQGGGAWERKMTKPAILGFVVPYAPH